MLPDSPGKSMPVLLVKPKASRYLQKVGTVSSSPMCMNQGLQELHSPSRKVVVPWPACFQQWMGSSTPSILIEPVQVNWLSSVISPSSRPMEPTHIL